MLMTTKADEVKLHTKMHLDLEDSLIMKQTLQKWKRIINFFHLVNAERHIYRQIHKQIKI